MILSFSSKVKTQELQIKVKSFLKLKLKNILFLSVI